MTTNNETEVREAIDARFRSGNSVPVERTHITAGEWEAIKAALASVQTGGESDTEWEQRWPNSETPPSVEALQKEVERLTDYIGTINRSNEMLLNENEDLRESKEGTLMHLREVVEAGKKLSFMAQTVTCGPDQEMIDAISAFDTILSIGSVAEAYRKVDELNQLRQQLAQPAGNVGDWVFAECGYTNITVTRPDGSWLVCSENDEDIHARYLAQLGRALLSAPVVKAELLAAGQEVIGWIYRDLILSDQPWYFCHKDEPDAATIMDYRKNYLHRGEKCWDVVPVSAAPVPGTVGQEVK